MKARLVARGFEQLWTQALTASPTPSLTTLLALLTLAIASDSNVNTYDVSTAFLHADVQEDVFVMPPPELQGTPRCPDGHCWKLKKALYGLRTAPLGWNAHLNAILVDNLGFRRSKADSCLFVHDTRKISLVIYVDDLLLVTNDTATATWFCKTLSQHVLLKHTGNLTATKSFKFFQDESSLTEATT